MGGYSDWQRTIARREAGQAKRNRAKGKAKAGGPKAKAKLDDGRPKRLSFKERQEWTALPGQIEDLEQELLELQERIADPAFFKGDPDEIRTVSQRVTEIPQEIDTAFERWGTLDERS